jgi:hypothetical protein
MVNLLRPQRRQGQAPAISILEAMDDPNLFRQHFQNTPVGKHGVRSLLPCLVYR